MPVLKYKTKNDMKIKDGSMKVYISGVREEDICYFERISNDIWTITDATVFYDGNISEGFYDEEWFGKLAGMHLFVGIISGEFLKPESKERKEFEFVLQNKIPVVPIFIEYGIDTIFNEEFGNLHGIPFNGLETKESYMEMLQRRIESILVGDILLERIRKEKDTYMFLSYRKKDFQQANEYMKYIHSMDKCEDIGFWYDDYLMPGENFETTIQEKLEKSDAVGLVVTPNIVVLNDENKENYVVEIEYPMAKKANKDILPIEMVKTDREQLNQKFEQLGEVVQKEQESYISEFVRKLIGEEKKQTDEHNFLIGMAYLKGIDREINAEKAEKLITQAGEKKYLEAVHKLVNMYRNGDGVYINLERQIYWQKILVDLLFKSYGPKKRNKSDKSKQRVQKLEEVAWECQELGKMLEEDGNISSALNVYKEAMDYCKNADKYTEEIIRVYLNLTHSYIDLKRENIASENDVKYLITKNKEAQNIGKKLVIKNPKSADIRLLYVLRIQEADLHWMWKKINSNATDKYLEIYSEAYNFLKKLTVHKELGVYYSDLIHVLEKRGDALWQLGKNDEAQKVYENAIKISEQWLEESDEEDAWMSLSINYEKIGDFYRDEYGEEGLEKAEKYLYDALQISKRLAESDSKNTLGRQLDLAGGYRRLGGIKELQEQWKEAEENYKFAYKIYENIAEKYSDNNECILKYAESCNDLADLYYLLRREAIEKEDSRAEYEYFELAEEYYMKVYDKVSQIPITYENAYRRQYAIYRYYYCMAISYAETKGDIKKAKEYLGKALKEARIDILKNDEEFRKNEIQALSALEYLGKM